MFTTYVTVQTGLFLLKSQISTFLSVLEFYCGIIVSARALIVREAAHIRLSDLALFTLIVSKRLLHVDLSSF